LFRLLDRGRRVPVTWVSGPPGAGKTLLVASYLGARKMRTVWYRLDESDVDLATLFQWIRISARLVRTPDGLSP